MNRGKQPFSDRNRFGIRESNHFVYKTYGRAKKELVAQLLVDQDGRCAICPNLLITPHLDHSHVTGEIRGLLCGECNTGLGMFKDDPLILARAIEYLTGVELEVPDPR